MSDLAPCPFCGAAPDVVRDSWEGSVTVYCPCDAGPSVTRPGDTHYHNAEGTSWWTDYDAGLARAAEVWNRRATVPA